MLKELIIAIQSYFKAHRFISKHRLWKWIIIPGIIYAILFFAGLVLFLRSSSDAISWLGNKTHILHWLHESANPFINFLIILGTSIFQLVLMLFYLSFFKYFFLIFGSPIFAYLSEKTEAILEGRDFPFNFSQLIKDIFRGIRIAIRNSLWQSVYFIAVLFLATIPLIGWATPVLALFVEFYYYGFSMLDYSCERHKLTAAESIDFIGKHKGLAIGNGMLFYLMHLVPVIGWVLAPAYAVVAATMSIYHQKDEL
ncbi:MAG: EI24 domain-containing protein [Bacteroidota bacterium]